ncbi:MAG: helix-turn-helix domain-containing protein [Pseudomonadota bacterium]
MTDQTPTQAGAATDFDGQPLSAVLMAVERRYICHVLNQANGNKAKAARLAGLNYQTFTRKLAALDLRVTYHAT